MARFYDKVTSPSHLIINGSGYLSSKGKRQGQVFYLPIKYSSFHLEAAQITYKELEVKRKKMAGFYDT